MTDKFDNLKPLLDIGWEDELKAYEDNGDICIINVKSVEKYPNYNIIFDGVYYYLINKDSVISKGKIKDNLIPDGFAKVV